MTIAKGVNKSVSTIRRSLKKLEALSIIKCIKFIRRVLSGLGANMNSILPYCTKSEQPEMNRREDARKVNHSKPEKSKSGNEPLFYKSLNNLVPNTYPEAPQSFYSVFKSRIVSTLGQDSQTLISKLYGIYRSQSLTMLKFGIYGDKQDQFQALAIQAIAITLQAKKKKPIKSITGFFSGVYSNLVSKHVIGFEDDYREAQSITGHDIEWSMPILQSTQISHRN